MQKIPFQSSNHDKLIDYEIQLNQVAAPSIINNILIEI